MGSDLGKDRKGEIVQDAVAAVVGAPLFMEEAVSKNRKVPRQLPCRLKSPTDNLDDLEVEGSKPSPDGGS
ncbi:MAG: hypothetical protein ACR2HR_08270 [Euzebya sp.]